MIRMSVMCPSGHGKKFDYDYYANKHMALVKQRMGTTLLRCEVDKGVAGGAPGAPAPLTANFTDITPQMQISEVIA